MSDLGGPDEATASVHEVSRETSVAGFAEDAGDHVSRETSRDADAGVSAPDVDVSRETSSLSAGVAEQPVSEPAAPAFEETPIAREAARAVHVRNVRQEAWPAPGRRPG